MSVPVFHRPLRVAGLLALFLLASPAPAGEIKLARHPDYHDGKIVFSYLGDLWLVKEDGSDPRRLTTHPAHDAHPRFSPDGKWIAFSSDRYGNPDVFVMPAQGGPARRLTYHSAADTVVGWSRDSKRVLFSSARGRVYPGIPSLYEVPIDGGLEQPLPTDWGYWGSYSPDGKLFAFNRHPMVWSRKHYRGSYAADLWVMDADGKNFRKILDADTPDEMKPNNFWPMFGDGVIYFVSDRGVRAKAGSPDVLRSRNNIWKVSANGGEPVQVTDHTSGSLFWPSMSSDGRVIVYEEDFGLWKLDTASGQTTRVKIDIISDDKENNLETQVVNGEADNYHLSPSGRRAVVSTHGELFTIATGRGDVRRLTQTPGVRETQPRWSPDGKWIAFVADTGGSDEVWLCDETGGQLKQISKGDSQKGQVVWSPDSKALLYTASDKKLYKHTLDGGKTDVVATGSSVGFGGAAIANPQWSPDGKWISFTRAGDNLLPHVYVIPAEGGKERRITDADSYSDSNAAWTPDGKRLVYLSGTDVGNIGQAGRSTAQIYTVSLSPEDRDPADRDVDSEADAQRQQRERRGAGRGGRGADAEDAAAAKVEVKIDFNGIGRRARQLTRSGDAVGSLTVAPDSRTVVFTTSGTEGGRPVQSIWSVGIDGEGLTRVAQPARPATEEDGPPAGGFGRGGLSSLQFARDGRTLYYHQGSGIYAVNVSPAPTGDDAPAPAAGGTGGGRGGRGGRGGGGGAAAAAPADTGAGATPRRINFTCRVEVDHRAERKQVFDESWRVMKHRFYDAAMHGVDWDRMRKVYEPLLEYVADREELHDVISEMIGELNASHTGISGGGRQSPGDQTRYPGFELEPDANGYYKVAHVYKRGPADREGVKLRAGDFILAIDGQPLKAGDNYWKYYTLAPGTKLELTVNDKPQKDGAWTAKVTPVSAAQYGTLQYEKWVADRREAVDKLSDGQVGYLHIRQMNEPSLRQFERDLADLHAKKALIIDQRFNPGGGIDQELLQILQQKQYQYTRVRDSVQVTRPLRGFFGPMVVMENERSTSDAEVFPDGFRTLKLGKIVGVTTYGAVIGTGSYQLMDGSSLRTPGSGLWNVSGTNLENYGVPPDVYVDNTPADFLKGRDAQLEKAVEVLKDNLKKKPAPAGKP
jgi:tricorn protease